MKNIKDLRDKVTRAKNNPEELINLLCKDFNIRQSEQDRWLTFEDINNEETFDMQEVYDTYAIRAELTFQARRILRVLRYL